MRRSGVRPAVKRSKLAAVMLRRAASGHIAATQLSKFAAASRIALAVISGWPEAPSSPLHGGGGPSGPGAACGAGAGVSGRRRCCRESSKSRCRRIERALRPDISAAWPEHSQRGRDHDRAGSFAIAVPSIACRVRPLPKNPASEGPVTVSNSLTEAGFCCRGCRPRKGQAKRSASYIRLCSRLQTGYQRAIKALSSFHRLFKAPDIP